MNKALPIQRSKTITSYGGVGSNVDTIENVSLLIRPFDEWNIYEKIIRNDQTVRRLKFLEPRLCARLKSIGFKNLKEFFILEDFDQEDSVKPYDPKRPEIERMVTSQFFPRWFYCPRCQRFSSYEKWTSSWRHDDNWNKNTPACCHCGGRTVGRGISRPPLQQIRFVMASMETGEIRDIPWNQILAKKGRSDEKEASVWYFKENDKPYSQNLKFKMSKGSADLYGLTVTDENNNKITLAEVVSRFIVMIDDKGNKTVYQPVIRSANNVYFSYTISSLFIPVKNIPEDVINQIKEFVEEDNITDVAKIKKRGRINLSEKEIQKIIDSEFKPIKEIEYSNEAEFRADEYDFITDLNNYNNGIFQDENDDLISEIYEWDDKLEFISGIYFQRRLKVTTVQVAYSRIDKISNSCLSDWSGQSEMPKQWFNTETKKVDKSVPVKLHPTCDGKIDEITFMPAVSSYGEGFFIQLDLSSIPKDDRFIFMHSLCHLIMKEIEFSCGYPLASLSERLYNLPSQPDDNDSEDRYGFLIYAASGEEGSYGGLTSLFYSDKIKSIIIQAILRAQDCPNDPICEKEHGHCFACLDIPETACEEFNRNLDRNVINDNCK